jgi:hypothetical protein
MKLEINIFSFVLVGKIKSRYSISSLYQEDGKPLPLAKSLEQLIDVA